MIEIHPPLKSVKLTVGIDNLFDKTFSEHLNLAGIGDFGYAANTRINGPHGNIKLVGNHFIPQNISA